MGVIAEAAMKHLLGVAGRRDTIRSRILTRVSATPTGGRVDFEFIKPQPHVSIYKRDIRCLVNHVDVSIYGLRQKYGQLCISHFMNEGHLVRMSSGSMQVKMRGTKPTQRYQPCQHDLAHHWMAY